MNKEFTIRHLTICFNDGSIKSNGIELSIDKKAVDVLELLIQNNQETVTIDEFMDAIWAKKPSSPEVVTSAIARLRKIFKMTGIGDDLITTVHKVGYRFQMPIETVKPEASIINTPKSPAFNYTKLFYVLLPIVLLTSLGIYFSKNIKTAALVDNPDSTQKNLASIIKESSSDMTQIFILRHTEKDSNTSEDPPLSEAGINRANYWKKVLQYVKFDRIFTTNYVRNIQTADIMKGDKNLNPEIYYPMSFEVLEFIKNIRGQKVLVIGHSNTIPDMINRIIGESTYPPMSHNNYNLMHLVTISKNGDTSSSVLHIEIADNN